MSDNGVFTADFAPNLPCPKGCVTYDFKGKRSYPLAKVSTIWTLGKEQGSASTYCTMCNNHYVWDFLPDIPFENQRISFRTDERHYSLDGVLYKASRKKGKGNASPSNDNSKPDVP